MTRQSDSVDAPFNRPIGATGHTADARKPPPDYARPVANGTDCRRSARRARKSGERRHPSANIADGSVV